MPDLGQVLSGGSVENSQSMGATSLHQCLANDQCTMNKLCMRGDLSGNQSNRVDQSTCTRSDWWLDQPATTKQSTCMVKQTWAAKLNNTGLATIPELSEDFETESESWILQSFVVHRQIVSKGRETTTDGGGIASELVVGGKRSL